MPTRRGFPTVAVQGLRCPFPFDFQLPEALLSVGEEGSCSGKLAGLGKLLDGIANLGDFV